MAIRGDWFYEESESWPGQAFGIRIKKILYEGKTMFQEVLVFESTDYGNVLVLDGVVQATERDEFAYQEMITHLAMMSHQNPQKVLVVGGGDGGCVREVLKHKSVQRVDLVEIDRTVIDLSLKYLPEMSKYLNGYESEDQESKNDPRVHVHICDGFKYLAEHTDQYDIIISDTSDPDGPAEQLFGKNYFQLLNQALTSQGVIAMQASENIWLRLDILKSLQETCSEVFPVVNYASTCVPTYTSGQLGLLLCAKDKNTNLKQPQKSWEDVKLNNASNKYYNEKIHASSFVLPTFVKRFISN